MKLKSNSLAPVDKFAAQRFIYAEHVGNFFGLILIDTEGNFPLVD